MIYVYDDPSKWGREVAMACGRAGVPIKFFTYPQDVPAGAVAWVRLDQYKDPRDTSKAVVEMLARKGVRVLPSLEDAKLYDDKIAQWEKLSRFMPETHVLYSDREAKHILNKLTLPFVSKASTGANSANVRLVRTKNEANKEIALAFSGRGIPISYGRKQKGYLLWQRFVEGNPHDYRVVLIGDYGRGLVRQNRPDVPFASGSGVNQPLTLETEIERKVYDFAWQIKDELGTEFLALDIVVDKDQPLLLEVTWSWTIGRWVTAPVFDRAGNRTPYTMGWQWDHIAWVLKRMMEETNGETTGHGVAQE